MNYTDDFDDVHFGFSYNDTLCHTGKKGMRWKKGRKSITDLKNEFQKKYNAKKRMRNLARRLSSKYLSWDDFKNKFNKKVEAKKRMRNIAKALGSKENAKKLKDQAKIVRGKAALKDLYGTTKGYFDKKKAIRNENNWREQDLKTNGLRKHMSNVHANKVNATKNELSKLASYRKAEKDFSKALVDKGVNFVKSYSSGSKKKKKRR